MEPRAHIDLEPEETRYRFRVSLDRPQGFSLTVDEPPPLGEGAGPNPFRLLMTAVGHCLSSSLNFCLEKSRIPDRVAHTEVEGELYRTEQGRWRIRGLKVTVRIAPPSDSLVPFDRCLTIFEDSCIVTQSVRQGIPVELKVISPTGEILYENDEGEKEAP